MKFKKNKNGQMTSSQLVKIILLIVGFAILILVFANIGWTEEINREICHASVILRGTLPDTFDLKNLPSLKCQTTKFCITDKVFGKGDCEEEFTEKEIKEEVETIRVGKDKTEEEINRFVARELASCWAMMGEGKVQIFTREKTTKKRCSVCSRIAFDKELKESLEEVKGFGNYLLTREVPNQDISYWEFLTGGVSAETYNENLDGFSTKEKAIVFMETTKSSWADWAVGGASAVAGGFTGSKIGAAVGFIIPFPGTTAAGAFAGGVVGFIGGGISGFFYDGGEKEIDYSTGWSFGDYKGYILKDLECSSFENIG